MSTFNFRTKIEVIAFDESKATLYINNHIIMKGCEAYVKNVADNIARTLEDAGNLVIMAYER